MFEKIASMTFFTDYYTQNLILRESQCVSTL